MSVDERTLRPQADPPAVLDGSLKLVLTMKGAGAAGAGCNIVRTMKTEGIPKHT